MTTSFQKPAGRQGFKIGDDEFAFTSSKLSLKYFDQFANYVVTSRTAINKDKNPLGILGAVQITAVPGGLEEKTAAVVDLVKRFGAQPLPPGTLQL